MQYKAGEIIKCRSIGDKLDLERMLEEDGYLFRTDHNRNEIIICGMKKAEESDDCGRVSERD